MDQTKTIIPRVRALSNTQLMKGGTRLVVSLIGVLMPGALKQPLVYTIFEDQKHGADMICSLMVDVLSEAAHIIGRLPRRLVIQADNTTNETTKHDRVVQRGVVDGALGAHAPRIH